MTEESRAGKEWTRLEEENLRLHWALLVSKMGGRTEAAVRSHLAKLSVREYRRGWPNATLINE